MRKFLIRWWYTANWEQEQHERMIRAFHEADVCGCCGAQASREAITDELIVCRECLSRTVIPKKFSLSFGLRDAPQ